MERLHDLPKVTQLIIGRGRIQTQAVWLQSKESASCAKKYLRLMYIYSIYLELSLCHVCKVPFFGHWPHVSGTSFQDILIFKDSFDVHLTPLSCGKGILEGESSASKCPLPKTTSTLFYSLISWSS